MFLKLTPCIEEKQKTETDKNNTVKILLFYFLLQIKYFYVLKKRKMLLLALLEYQIEFPDDDIKI